MDFDYDERSRIRRSPDAYELLLLEAMRGDHSLFIRRTASSARGRSSSRCSSTDAGCFYERGSWGPQEAEELIRPRKWYVSGVHDAHESMSRAYPIPKER